MPNCCAGRLVGKSALPATTTTTSKSGPPRRIICLRGSGQVSGSGPKTLRLDTLLCGLGNKMKIILSWARKDPKPVLRFPKVWATRSCVGFVQTLREKNHRFHSTHPALESLQTQGTSKFLSRVVTVGFHTLDGGVSTEFPGVGSSQPRPASASRLLGSYSHLALATQPSLAWGNGRREGSVSASKGSIFEWIPSKGKTQQ